MIWSISASPSYRVAILQNNTGPGTDPVFIAFYGLLTPIQLTYEVTTIFNRAELEALRCIDLHTENPICITCTDSSTERYSQFPLKKDSVDFSPKKFPEF